MDWTCKNTWRRAAYNTSWCLLGCSIGDFGTIWLCQFFWPLANPFWVMSLAMINGLITSIILETIILWRTFHLKEAFKTAITMSFISMLMMELAMNVTDYMLVGSAKLTWWSIGPALLIGFLTPWPYNYWRLKKHGKSCH